MDEPATALSTINSPSVLARLGTLAPSLRESERKIADYILTHPDEITYMSITELAERTDTSEATVIRFAQRLGYSGYAALKIALTIDRRDGAVPLPPGPGLGVELEPAVLGRPDVTVQRTET